MGHDILPLFAIVGFFGSVITFIYMKYKSRHAERMALIESGQTADVLSEKNYSNSENGLKTGLFLIGGGLGFVAGRILETIFDWHEPSGIIPMALVGAGIGLVVFYRIVRTKE